MGVCAALFQKTKEAKQSFEHYKNAFFFLLFTGLYFAVLYLQADSTTVQQVATSHAYLFPPVRPSLPRPISSPGFPVVDASALLCLHMLGTPFRPLSEAWSEIKHSLLDPELGKLS